MHDLEERPRLERVTPRIGAEATCRCVRTITWDEVFGWLHTAPAASAGPPCPVAEPTRAAG